MTPAPLLALISTLALTAGCATSAAVLTECDWADPIRPSRADTLTDATLAQIVAHNEIGEKLCGWKTPSKE